MGIPTSEPRIDNSQPGVFMPTMEPMPKPVVIEDETCLPWDLPDMRGATVSAIRLGVPSKARGEYEKACSAFKRKKMPDAEQHVRGAIEKYPNYQAAWVMLGEVLQDEQKMPEAHDACTQALSVDPTYLPPYLCLAGLLDKQSQWNDLLALSGRFMGMNPVGDRYAYYYSGIAHFHLYNLPEAQKSVTQAIAIDTEHHQPGLYFLLAQIYGEQGELADAEAQIRLFLKYNNVKQDKDAAKQYLATLQSERNVK
jgi:tetratricopeptide (TPR) repeat protein